LLVEILFYGVAVFAVNALIRFFVKRLALGASSHAFFRCFVVNRLFLVASALMLRGAVRWRNWVAASALAFCIQHFISVLEDVNQQRRIQDNFIFDFAVVLVCDAACFFHRFIIA